MYKVLSIAGSDCSGGAGIQADIKTIAAHGMYAMTVITALTAQNTTGVYGVLEADKDFVARQIDCVFQDIRPDAVKVGMVANAQIIAAIADKLEEYEAKNIVVDPVMVSTSGGSLLNEDAVEALKTRLLPLADVITPNIPEAECLSGVSIQSNGDMERAAEQISLFCRSAILIKGGHQEYRADDLLYYEDCPIWFPGRKVDNPNTHGTGCTLSSAIACNLAKGLILEEAVFRAKKYITGALFAGLNLGEGSGPLDHGYRMRQRSGGQPLTFVSK